MADIATFDEAKKAISLKFDLISTTLSGYTEESKNFTLPNLELLKNIIDSTDIPVIAEGKISTPIDMKKSFELGAYAVVVGTAITRPREITKTFVSEVPL